MAFSIFSAAAPHGTCGAQTTTLRSGFARSANDAMPLGLPGAVAICRTFVAKTVGGAGGQAGVGDRLHGRVAGRGEDVGGRAVDDLLGEVGRPGVVQLDVDARVGGLELLLQRGERLGQRGGGEDRERARLRGRAADRCRAGGLRPPAAARQQQSEARDGQDTGSHEIPPGVSTTTFVDLITATASTPGSSPSSRDGLAAHQRDHPVRTALHLDLRHHLVGDHLGDQADEAVAGGPADARRVGGGVRVPAGELGQRGAVDDLAVRRVGLHGKRAGVDPPPDGVVADAEQPGGLGDTELRHGRHCIPASAE